MLDEVRALAEDAGRATLEFFRKDFEVVRKGDDSPLTCADRAAHEVLVAGLPGIGEGWPVLSEESRDEEIRDRREWSRYWLVDPLDGTKEFVRGTGQFTVNVALIEDGRSILGVVHHPPGGVTYMAARGEGAFRGVGGAAPEAISTRRADPERLSLILSASHSSERLKRYLAERPGWSVRSAGSSLKFCLVAAGEVDVYPRLGPTMEWDTGAAQCVVEEAGGQVLDIDAGTPLVYNKEELLNPHLITLGDPDLDWRGILEAAGGEP